MACPAHRLNNSEIKTKCHSDEASPSLWNNNPIDRDQLLLKRGLHRGCAEVDDHYDGAVDKRYQKIIQATPQKALFVKKDAFSIQYLKGHTTEAELEKLGSLLMRLNAHFPKARRVHVDYTGRDSGILLFGAGPIRLSVAHKELNTRLGQLTHEFGHRVFASHGFIDDKDLEKLLVSSWFAQNHLIVKDSSYIHPDSVDMDLGHIETADELFASSLRAYFHDADQFAAFIQNPTTPDHMKEFGKAIWSYMRDRAFKGQVFTTTKRDPFPDASHGRYNAKFTQDPHQITVDKFRANDFNMMETGPAEKYLDTERVITGLPGTIGEIMASGGHPGLTILVEISRNKNPEAFYLRALMLLDQPMKSEDRLYLLQLLGDYVGPREDLFVDLLLEEHARGPAVGKEMALCLLKTKVARHYSSIQQHGDSYHSLMAIEKAERFLNRLK